MAQDRDRPETRRRHYPAHAAALRASCNWMIDDRTDEKRIEVHLYTGGAGSIKERLNLGFDIPRRDRPVLALVVKTVV